MVIFFRAEDRSRGIDIVRRSEAYMTSIRGDSISMIFQEASTSLNPVLTIGYQVGESFHFHRRAQMLEETIRELDGELAGKMLLARAGLEAPAAVAVRPRAARAEVLRGSHRPRSTTSCTGWRMPRAPHELKRRELLNHRRDELREKSALAEFVKRVPFVRRYQRRLERTVRRHVVELLRSLGVANPERIAGSHPHELSGGMQQRIVIAIALACHPVLLIADEPTSNLDVTIQAQIIDLIRVLKQTAISSVLFITHDLGLVAEICDRTSVMYAGDIAETAGVKELFANPLHPYTQGLLRSVPQGGAVRRAGDHPRHRAQPDRAARPAAASIPGAPTGWRSAPRRSRAMVEHSPGHWVACHLYTDGKR